MVLLAAAVCTKQGKALVSRQFVEMTRARIEGLLAAFSKLVGSGKQHTFVETESVRYVYQPLEQLYMMLVTTKTSNILEDLETLRLFSKVIPEYCHSLDEQDVLDNSFDLIFAFDEIVALGYRENVNLAQIRTFTEMDSYEEKVYEAIRKSQEKEARDEMKRKAKELQLAKRDARRGHGGGFTGGFGSQDYHGGRGGMAPSIETLPPSDIMGSSSSYGHAGGGPSSRQPSRPRSSGSAMKLGKKGKDIDSFVDKLEQEGEKVINPTAPRQSTAVSKLSSAVTKSSVHLKTIEKLSLVAGRDGGLQSMELQGILHLRISDPDYRQVKVAVTHQTKMPVQFQTHPNINKAVFGEQGMLGMKDEGKSFPLNQDIGVLKWRLQTTDESLMPLSINCWPSENAGKCDVSIEYELLQEALELSDVVISIPVPSGVGAPVISEIDGEYHYDNRKHVLEWRLPVVDGSNSTGKAEFTIAGVAGDFFPVRVAFVSTHSYCNMEVVSVSQAQSSEAVKFSKEIIFTADKYEIV